MLYDSVFEAYFGFHRAILLFKPCIFNNSEIGNTKFLFQIEKQQKISNPIVFIFN